MLQSLTLRNFRNFQKKEISLSPGKTLIIGENGSGKTNLLEAISLPLQSLVETDFEYLIAQGEDVFHISYMFSGGKSSISYELKTKKKHYQIESKNTTKNKFSENYPHVISFHPLMMNLLYHGPSERRGFLDEVLIQCFPDYKKILSAYKKVVSHRNKILKNISEGKSEDSELSFWNTKYIDGASLVHEYRRKLTDWFEKYIHELGDFFFGKVRVIEFQYLSKTSRREYRENLKNYIESEKIKEVILKKTLRGPHIDDFQILVDGVPLEHFASRGEVKSTLIGLKILASRFLENESQKEILFIVDDILSELDIKHSDYIWKYIGGRQCVISSITDIEIGAEKIFI